MTFLIGDNLVVSMHYKLTNDEGTLLDSSDGGEPLTYLHGASNIIPGLEKELVGKIEGSTLKVRVEPAEAYGEVVDEMVHTVDKSAFNDADIEVGMTFHAQSPEGDTQQITIKAVDGDQVTIDANHPLAGVALTFDVEVVSIREATEDEITKGHTN